MRLLRNTVATALFAVGSIAYAQSNAVPAGTAIDVRTNEAIDAKNTSDGRIFTGVVDRDVLDANGNIAIPRGSNAELIVRDTSGRDLALDLESVSVSGRRYIVGTDDVTQSAAGRDGLGKNKRTGEFVGGGALLGTIIGAIGGGGKGAAIGALAGGAAGAGAQVLTRGKSVRVPAESVLTFRTNTPLRISAAADRGYDRDGRHYHRYPNDR